MKLISFVILILSVLSDFDPKLRLYEDCARTIYTDKNGIKQQNYVDASSVDDCKDRKILEYVDSYYENYDSYTEKYNDYYKVKDQELIVAITHMMDLVMKIKIKTQKIIQLLKEKEVVLN